MMQVDYKVVLVVDLLKSQGHVSHVMVKLAVRVLGYSHGEVVKPNRKHIYIEPVVLVCAKQVLISSIVMERDVVLEGSR